MRSKPSQVLSLNRELIRDIVLSHRSSNPRVFGSVLRGTDTESSDLDLLVDLLPGATLIDLGAIQDELQEALGIPVDVLTPKELPASFRTQVLREAAPVCAYPAEIGSLSGCGEFSTPPFRLKAMFPA